FLLLAGAGDEDGVVARAELRRAARLREALGLALAVGGHAVHARLQAVPRRGQVAAVALHVDHGLAVGRELRLDVQAGLGRQDRLRAAARRDAAHRAEILVVPGREHDL